MEKEEQILNLLELLAIDVKSVKDDVKSVKDDLQEVNIKLDTKANTKDIAEFEHRVMNKLNVLFDGNTQVNSKIDRIEDSVNDISKKVDNQEVEIRVLKAVK